MNEHLWLQFFTKILALFSIVFISKELIQMEIILPPALEKFVEEKVSAGHFN
jgi:hypothetical protein